MRSTGVKCWAIAEGYIPAGSHGPEPQFTNYETMRILYTTDAEAHISVTIFYADREPGGPYRVVVPARRTPHIRFNNLIDPEPIPRDTDFASLIESDVQSAVQHRGLIRAKRKTR